MPVRPRRNSPSAPEDGPVSLRARRRSSPLVLVACLLVSLGLNYGSLWASLALFSAGERTSVPVARKQKVCVDGGKRSLRLLDASLSGEPVQLIAGVKQVVFDGECEPVPMMVALLDEPPVERDPLEELLPPEEKDKPRPKLKEKDKEKPKELPPEPEPEKPRRRPSRGAREAGGNYT